LIVSDRAPDFSGPAEIRRVVASHLAEEREVGEDPAVIHEISCICATSRRARGTSVADPECRHGLLTAAASRAQRPDSSGG
jgi:hypothetical protein